MDGHIANCADVLDAFSDFQEDKIISEEDLITDILKILKSIDNNPLYYYCILKTVLTKKSLLSESNKKELMDILDIKPIIKEKIVVKEKIVYKEKKVKRVYEDDY